MLIQWLALLGLVLCSFSMGVGPDCPRYLVNEAVENVGSPQISVATQYAGVGNRKVESLVAVNGNLYVWEDQEGLDPEYPLVAVSPSFALTGNLANDPLQLRDISMAVATHNGVSGVPYLAGMGSAFGEPWAPYFLYFSEAHDQGTISFSAGETVTTDADLLNGTSLYRQGAKLNTSTLPHGEKVVSVRLGAGIPFDEGALRFPIYVRTTSGKIFSNSISVKGYQQPPKMENRWKSLRDLSFSQFEIVEGTDFLVGVQKLRNGDSQLILFNSETVETAPFTIDSPVDALTASGKGRKNRPRVWFATTGPIGTRSKPTSRLFLWEPFSGTQPEHFTALPKGQSIVALSATVGKKGDDTLAEYLSLERIVGDRRVSDRIVLGTLDTSKNPPVYRIQALAQDGIRDLPWNLRKTPRQESEAAQRQAVENLDFQSLIAVAKQTAAPTEPVFWNPSLLSLLEDSIERALQSSALPVEFRPPPERIRLAYQQRVEIVHELSLPKGIYQKLKRKLDKAGFTLNEQVFFIQLFAGPAVKAGALPVIDVKTRADDIERLIEVFKIPFDRTSFYSAIPRSDGRPGIRLGAPPGQTVQEQDAQTHMRIRGAINSVYRLTAQRYNLVEAEFGTPSYRNDFSAVVQSPTADQRKPAPRAFVSRILAGISLIDPLFQALTLEDGQKFLKEHP